MLCVPGVLGCLWSLGQNLYLWISMFPGILESGVAFVIIVRFGSSSICSITRDFIFFLRCAVDHLGRLFCGLCMR